MKKNILVTGSHRSGSTWTGKVLARAEKVRYIHEPFNIGIKRVNSPLAYWFEYLEGTPQAHQEEVRKYLDSFFSFFNTQKLRRLLTIRSKSDIHFFLTDYKGTLSSDRTIIKDPIAIMSAEWLAKNYDCSVVMMIRHPAAFVASLKVKSWEFDFNNLNDQAVLIEQKLDRYKDQIKEYATTKKDIIDQGILLWNVIHAVIDDYQKRHSSDWYFIKHEDLSIDPVKEFKNLFEYLELNFSEKISNHIIETTTAGKESNWKRDSKSNVKTWKERLTANEISRVKQGTMEVWPKFYTESDW